jgi:hypothetical protein
MQVFRRAAVIHPDGTTREIWWLVDNGVIGADGVARTASPPYPGVYSGGDYWIRVHSKSVDAQTGAREVMAVVARVNWQAVVEFTVGIGMFVPSLMAGNTGAGLAYLATLLENANFIDLSVLEWTTTAQYWRTVLVENGAGVPIRVDLQPAAPRRVSDPVIHSIQRVSPNQFTLTGQNFNVPSGQTRLKAWIRPIGGAALSSEQRGNTQPIRGLIWTSFDVNVESDGSVKLQVPDDFAVGLHEVWLERTPSTLLPITAPRASEVFASNRVQFAQAQLAHDRDLEVWLDRSRLTFGKRNDDGGLEILPGEAITLPGGAEALTGLVGSKNRPLAYGPDGRVLFIAGYGKLFMVDVLSRKLVHTLDVPAASGRNFTSLALAGDWLYMAEGGSNEQLGPNPARLLRVNVNFKSPHFLSAIEAIDLPDSVQIGTNGILDMVVSGGRYLALTTPLSKGRTGLDTSGARGNVYVIDLLGNGSDPDPNRHLNVIDGTNVATVHFEPAAGPQSPGRYPMYVTTGPMTGQFLISTPGSYNQGLATAQVVEREPGTDEQLVVVSRSMPRLAPSGIASAWPGDFLQNIQKASGVAVTADGMWAFVADYNQPWAEPGFDFGWYALKQAGGKIGVIYDPFGSPRFMGATVPIENFMLDGLALSYDGRRLLATGIDLEWGSPHAGTVFDFEVSELIEAALWHGSAGKDLNVPLGLSDDLQPALLPARYLDGDRLHRPMAALTGQGLLDLVSPSFSTGDSERRPAFELKGTQPITALRLFISSFAEGEGLFPNDMPILPDWHLGDKNASGPAHDERIATIDIDLAVLPEFSNGAVPADQLITLSDFTRDEYLHFALTAGQKYWWGVEATFANGTSARKASQFKVAPAWKADTGRAGSYVTIITHGAQPPDNQTRLGAKPTLNEISGTRSVAARLPLTEMALSIANDQEGDAFIFDRALGEWVQLGDRSNKTLTEALQAKSPVILVNDWAWETFLSDSGFTEAAADGLYAALVQAHLDSGSKLLKGPLHLIGHSRGAVVNTELAQRILLGMYRPSGGIQMTTLDPHDFKQKSLTLDETISSLAFNAARKSFSQGLIDAAKLGPQILKRFLDEWFGEKEGDSEELKRAKKIGRKALDMTLTLPGEVALGPFKIILDLLAVLEITPAQLGLKEISFADQREPTIRAWEGIDYADNYFQVVANGDAEPSVTFTPNGRQLDDFDFNFNLTGLKAFTEDDSITPFGSLAVVHGRPVAWYYGTVDSSAAYLGHTQVAGDQVWNRDWIVRRRADRSFEATPWSPNFGGAWFPPEIFAVRSFAETSPYEDDQRPWYLQGVTGTTFDNAAMQSRLQSQPVIPDTWEGVGIGWARSLLGGGQLPGAPAVARTPLSQDNTNWGASGSIIPGIFNGDFQASERSVYGRYLASYAMPGWSFFNSNDPSASHQDLQGFNLSFLSINQDRLNQVAQENNWTAEQTSMFVKSVNGFEKRLGEKFTLRETMGLLRLIDLIQLGSGSIDLSQQKEATKKWLEETLQIPEAVSDFLAGKLVELFDGWIKQGLGGLAISLLAPVLTALEISARTFREWRTGDSS